LFYLALAYIPAAYLGGNHKVGSEQQQHETTARLLAVPGGQALVVVLGLVVMGICGNQIFIVAIGLAVFALFSFIEARFRDVER
jgi:hypothetical protein